MTDKRICFVCTQSFALATLYKGLFPYLSKDGWSVTAVTGDTEFCDFPFDEFGDFELKIIPMERLPSLRKDLSSARAFMKFFRSNRFDVIHVSTPKAALVASLSARLTSNGKVVFVYRRCVYEMMSGFKRFLFKTNDFVTARLSHYVVPISYYYRDFLIRERIASEGQLRMIGEGSSNGIDTTYFRRDQKLLDEAAGLRKRLGIRAEQPVLLYVGRLISEKGVDYLPEIFSKVQQACPDVCLVVVGPEEAGRDPIRAETRTFLNTTPNVYKLGYLTDPRPAFTMSTVFIFPSLFEGFGNVLLEASALEKASVAFDVSGVNEAISDGISGLLVPLGDVDAFASAALRLIQNDVLRSNLESQGRARVVRQFDRRVILAKIAQFVGEIAPGNSASGARDQRIAQ